MDQREHRKRGSEHEVKHDSQSKTKTLVWLRYDVKNITLLRNSHQQPNSADAPQQHLWGSTDISQDHIKLFNPNTHEDYRQRHIGAEKKVLQFSKLRHWCIQWKAANTVAPGKWESRCCCWAQQHSWWEAENSRFTTTAAFRGCYFY